jgi:glyoxylase-like metal-dependent hydrolase (beta-lactamase superfamily II)/rhodanese-related sulfurtransferase
VHADHVTGASMAQAPFGSTIVVSKESGVDGADRYVAHGDKVAFGESALAVRATPGHTQGCVTYVLDDESMAFTGDCLLIRGSGRTDFQQGSAQAMYRSVHTQILTLPDACLLYPAHDYRGLTVTSVGGRERSIRGWAARSARRLHRLHGQPRPAASEADGHRGAGQPARGRPEGATTGADQSWAPLTYTFAGISEITPQTLEEIAVPVEIIDVREPDEYVGPLGHIRGAKLIRSDSSTARADELPRDRPLVMVCRSGARSAQATVLLQRAGFPQVANLNGGMLRWRADGHSVAWVDSRP